MATEPQETTEQKEDHVPSVQVRDFPAAKLESLKQFAANETDKSKPVAAGEALRWAALKWHDHMQAQASVTG